MASLLTRAARAAGLSADDQRAAESRLGRGHRLTRAVANQHTLAVHCLTVGLAVVAGAVDVALGGPHALLALAVAAVLMVAFVAAWALARQTARDRTHDLIAAGADPGDLAVVGRERRRLSSRKERERLARSLEALYQDALRRHGILPHFRPPYGVAKLREAAHELRALTAALRRDDARVQGVALTTRLLTDGCTSPLYADELGPLREELNRIRYLLEYAGPGAGAGHHAA